MIRDILANIEGVLAASGTAATLSEARSPETWARLASHPEGRARLAALDSTAKELLAAPLLALPFSDFMRYYRDGSRIEYENLYFDHRHRLEVFAIRALAEGNAERSLRALEDTIWAICDEYSWCLPAHMPLDPGAEGKRPHRIEVDLFAAETAWALAEILALLGDRLSSEVAARARREVFERVLDSVMDFPAPCRWESMTNNWAAVCAGGVGAAAIHIIEDNARLARLLRRLGPSFDNYLSGFEADGACTEGMGYWTYGFGFYVCFSELLRERTGGSIDLLLDPSLAEKIEQIVRFPGRVRLSADTLACFSDASQPFRYPLGILSRLAKRFPGVELPPYRFSEPMAADHARRWCKHLRDFLWFDPAVAVAADAETSTSCWLPQSQWLTARRQADSLTADLAVGFAAKAGHNEEPHNQNDVGSFLLVVGDDIFLDDFGAGLYDRGYFGPERYSYLVNRSAGHSVPILDGREQAEGKHRRASAVVRVIEGTTETLTMDLAPAYPAADDPLAWQFADSTLGVGRTPEADKRLLKSLRRSFRFEADPRTGDAAGIAVLSLADHFLFGGRGKAVVRERFVTLKDARIEGSHAVILEGERASVRVTAAAAPVRIEFAEIAFFGHRKERKLARLIDFVYEIPAGSEFDAAFSFAVEKRS